MKWQLTRPMWEITKRFKSQPQRLPQKWVLTCLRERQVIEFVRNMAGKSSGVHKKVNGVVIISAPMFVYECRPIGESI